jgi:hypothetical protein
MPIFQLADTKIVEVLGLPQEMKRLFADPAMFRNLNK